MRLLGLMQSSICVKKQKRYTVKPLLNGHTKVVNTKILMTNGRLIEVENIAECIVGFCNTFDLHKAINGLGNQFSVFLEWPFYTGFTVRIIDTCYG